MPGDIVGLLLAAGASTRFGADKRLHRMSNGVPIAVTAARRLISAIPNSIAVIRASDTQLHALLANTGLRIVINHQAEQGMGTSIASGVCAAQHAAGWVIALADMPFTNSHVIAQVASALQSGATIAAPRHQQLQGHPVGFNAQFADALTQLHGDVGARHILQQHAQLITWLPTDDAGVLQDIDTPADLSLSALFSCCLNGNCTKCMRII